MLAEQLRAAGAMTVLLKDALKPNLVQTLEGQPALVHCGPFANIAHGNNSLVADLVALKLGDYVVTESGFGADMGMEKFLNIVCRAGGLSPSAVVLVATAKALKHHGGDPGRRPRRDRARRRQPRAGTSRSCAEFGLRAVVAVNRFPGDTDDEVELVRRLALEHGAHAAELNEAFERGGAGAAALAEAVVDAADHPNEFEYTYPIDAPIEAKIEAIAKRVYGAGSVVFLQTAKDKIKQYAAGGLDRLPICMAKTHLSLSHDPAARERADGLRAHRPRRACVHGRGLARRALRDDADDAGARRRRPPRSTSTSTRTGARLGSSSFLDAARSRSSSTQCPRGRLRPAAARSPRSRRRSPPG